MVKVKERTSSKVLLRRRHGVVIVYVALALVVLMGAAGLSIDVGNLYLQRSEAQRAADAAALAGAIQLMNFKTNTDAETAADTASAANGFDKTQGATVTVVPSADGNPARYRVFVSKPAPLFFMAIFGWRYKTVGAQATATFASEVPMDINGGQQYGVAGKVMLAMFGPYGQHQYGDDYSPLYLQNNDPNPLYETTGQYGYDYDIAIPKNYATINGTNTVQLDIYDPDIYNANGSSGAVAGQSVDEIQSPQSGNPKNDWLGKLANYDGNTGNTSVFTLYDTKGTPQTDDDEVIATATYDGDSSHSTDLQWVTPDGFSFDITDPRWASRFSDTSNDDPVDFRLNAKTINGSGDNGFNLRAGPPEVAPTVPTKTIDGYYSGYGYNKTWHPAVTQYYYNNKWNNDPPPVPFDSNNGTKITGDGRIPMIFSADGTVAVTLGKVPAGATSVSITKFDTDIGATSLIYNDGISNYTGTLGNTVVTTSTKRGKTTTTSTLVTNDQISTDTYDLGANYPGGTWIAHYTADANDTSTWEMSYIGPASGKPKGVYLVQ